MDSNKIKKSQMDRNNFLDLESNITCFTYKTMENFNAPLANIGLWMSRTFPRIGKTRDNTPFNRGVNCNALTQFKRYSRRFSLSRKRTQTHPNPKALRQKKY